MGARRIPHSASVGRRVLFPRRPRHPKDRLLRVIPANVGTGVILAFTMRGVKLQPPAATYLPLSHCRPGMWPMAKAADRDAVLRRRAWITLGLSHRERPSRDAHHDRDNRRSPECPGPSGRQSASGAIYAICSFLLDRVSGGGTGSAMPGLAAAEFSSASLWPPPAGLASSALRKRSASAAAFLRLWPRRQLSPQQFVASACLPVSSAWRNALLRPPPSPAPVSGSGGRFLLSQFLGLGLLPWFPRLIRKRSASAAAFSSASLLASAPAFCLSQFLGLGLLPGFLGYP